MYRTDIQSMIIKDSPKVIARPVKFKNGNA